MAHRIVWVHGIGNHQPGYSAGWTQVYNRYLNLPDDSYVEVVWETALEPSRAAARGRGTAAAPLRLTRMETLAEKEVRERKRQD
jgi:hypothetical protein